MSMTVEDLANRFDDLVNEANRIAYELRKISNATERIAKVLENEFTPEADPPLISGVQG